MTPKQIYDLLEQEITAYFYDRNEAGIPETWVRMMKESICTSSRFVNMNRVLIDYQNQFYTPAIDLYRQLAENDHHLLRTSASQQHVLKELWPGLRIVSCTTSADTKKRLLDEDTIEVECQVELGQANTDMVSVEMYYEYEDTQFKVSSLALHHQEESIATYTGQIKLTGYGRQRMNVRVRPANEILQDLNPAWMKWA